MRIAVAGNQWITRYLIDALHEAGAAPSLIINMSAHLAERISGYTDLAEDAARMGATLYRPEKYSLVSPQDEAALKKHEIDLLLVFGWQRLIPAWLIEHCSLGAFGVHGGPELPPRCRGRAVFNWALLLGYKKFHMYAFRLTPGVDDGDIAGLQSFDILPADDILTLYHKNCVASTRLFIDLIEQAKSGAIETTPQSQEGATYLPKREPDNGGIDWTQSAERIVDLVRALCPPYPGAFTALADERVFIDRAQVFDSSLTYEGEPGTIADVFPNGDFIVLSSTLPVYVRAWRGTRFSPQRGLRFEQRSGIPLADPVL